MEAEVSDGPAQCSPHGGLPPTLHLSLPLTVRAAGACPGTRYLAADLLSSRIFWQFSALVELDVALASPVFSVGLVTTSVPSSCTNSYKAEEHSSPWALFIGTHSQGEGFGAEGPGFESQL